MGSRSLSPQEVGRRVGREALGAEWGRPDTYLRVPGSRPRARPSASSLPSVLHVAPRLLLRGRCRREPGRARARLPAPAPRRLARPPGVQRAALLSPAPLWGERRQQRLPHVSPGCPVSQQFPPGPQRRLRRCCHRLSHIPGLQRSRRRRRRRAATTTLRTSACSLLLLAPPTRVGPTRSGGGSAGGRRQAAAAPSPQSTARLRRGGRAAAGPGGAERSPPRERGYDAGAAGVLPERETAVRLLCTSSHSPARTDRNPR